MAMFSLVGQKTNFEVEAQNNYCLLFHFLQAPHAWKDPCVEGFKIVPRKCFSERGTKGMKNLTTTYFQKKKPLATKNEGHQFTQKCNKNVGT